MHEWFVLVIASGGGWVAMIMNSGKIQNWISCIGKTHTELLADSLISDDDLSEIFPEDDELYLEPEVGISMSFWRATGRFESLYVTLLKVIDVDVAYEGGLPEPFSLSMTQSQASELFGQPLQASGPIKMPQPVGQTGGWDYYQLDAERYPNIKVQFQYLVSMEVNCIVFTMIDKGHD